MDNSIAFIGLGNMGAPMAANLAAAGNQVRGYDLSEASKNAASSLGVKIADSVLNALNGANIVITMLPSGDNVLSVWNEIVKHVKRDALLIDCSTIDVESSREAHSIALNSGCLSLDAPVSGGVKGAANGSLTFMVGGTKIAMERGAPLFEAMGKQIVHCGAAGSGQAAKICNNMILGITMAGVCEAFVLGEKLGLAHQVLYDVASTSSGQCWSLNSYCPVPGPVPSSPANHGYKPGFAAKLMLKDLKLSLSAAEKIGAITELAAVAETLFTRMDQMGRGTEDFSSLINILREKHV